MWRDFPQDLRSVAVGAWARSAARAVVMSDADGEGLLGRVPGVAGHGASGHRLAKRHASVGLGACVASCRNMFESLSSSEEKVQRITNNCILYVFIVMVTVREKSHLRAG